MQRAFLSPLRHTALAALLVIGASGAQAADEVLLTSGIMMGGPQFASYTFEISDIGSAYKASLLDYAMPASFDYLSLAVTRGASLLGTVTGGGSFTFSALEVGTYTALVFGDTGGAFDAGSYGITISAVPEAETWAMLVAGLGMLGMVVRRRDQKLAGLQIRD
ncbi:MAG: FxDxF family PEP-CTERM protein [Pseudomonadota bacterium]